MKSALEKGRNEFVELLLDQGVNMANFLSNDKLEGLYSAVSFDIYFLSNLVYLKYFSVQFMDHTFMISTQKY